MVETVVAPNDDANDNEADVWTTQEPDGNVSVTNADNEKEKAQSEEKTQRAFVVGPKFSDALDAQLAQFNAELEANKQPKVTMSNFLRKIVAEAIGFDIALDPRKSKSKYATDDERRAAIKASQQKAAEERKKFNKLIAAAKNKETRKEAIMALMASLGITDDDLE